MGRKAAPLKPGEVTVGNKVALMGEFYGKTREEWADILGVAPGTVGSYKNKKNANPGMDILRPLIELTGVPESWFRDGKVNDPPGPRIWEEAIGEARVKAVRAEEQTRNMRLFATTTEVELPVWRSTMASGEDECEFVDNQGDARMLVPSFFLSNHNPDEFIVCVPSGVSMAPRIVQGDFIIARLNPAPPPGTIVIARKPEGNNFVKVLKMADGRLELHSINQKVPPIKDLDQWVTRASVVGIWKPYILDSPNIEFNGGTPLRG